MKIFEEPILKVLTFGIQDVITTSQEEEEEDYALMPPCA